MYSTVYTVLRVVIRPWQERVRLCSLSPSCTKGTRPPYVAQPPPSPSPLHCDVPWQPWETSASPFSGMDGWSVFRKFSTRRKRTSKTPPALAPSAAHKPAMAPITVPDTQSILLLYGPRQPYQLVEQYPVPQLKNEREVLVRTRAIGLNPIDWKAPDYNFAIPELPYLSGRESAGDVCQVVGLSSRLKNGDRVRHLRTTKCATAGRLWNASYLLSACHSI